MKCGSLVIDKYGRILLVLQRHSLKWGLPKGSQYTCKQNGQVYCEPPNQTCIRELFEETKLDLTEHKFSVVINGNSKRLIKFELNYSPYDYQLINNNEIIWARFYTLDSIRSMLDAKTINAWSKKILRKTTREKKSPEF